MTETYVISNKLVVATSRHANNLNCADSVRKAEPLGFALALRHDYLIKIESDELVV